ncbi:MAG: hypothetical protein FJY29_12125 [Betaproteobacteria bacterium]|nr:hypothetical protein [Betaproteobacteria bacterium]
MTSNNWFAVGLASLTCSIAGGCAMDSSSAPKPYKAEVIDHLPPTTERGEQWLVAPRNLSLLEDIDTLQSNFFSVNLGGVIKISSNFGSLVSAELDSTSNRGRLRYTVKNGVIIPRDTSSLLALSSFYAFERTINALKASTGLEPQSLKEKINGPFNLYFEPTILEKDGAHKSFYTIKFNAAFNSENNQFYLFRRSEIESIPFSANIKVISHEFGHALFKTSFNQNTVENCTLPNEAELQTRREDKFFRGRWSLEYAISGLNEGFADFHSYVVTSSADIFAELNPAIANNSRALNGIKFNFSQLGNDSACAGRFYCIGTLFARSLYNVAKRYSNNRAELMGFSRRVYAALEKTAENMRKSPAVDIIPFANQEALMCKRRDRPVLTYDGALTSSFLAAFLQSFTAGEEKKLLCENFTELFGTTGFAQKVRVVCEP